MHFFQNFIVRLIPNRPPPLETRIWKLVVRALFCSTIAYACNRICACAYVSSENQA